MADSQRWRATLAEHRTAWLISTASLILILLAMFRPEIFDFHSSVDQTVQATTEKPVTRPEEPTYSAIPPAAVKTPAPSAEPEQVADLPGQASHPMPVQTTPEPTALVKPATASKPPASKSPLATGTYYVQTGAFKDKSHADKLAADINRKGWPARVVKKPGDLFAVWVGPRNTRTLAATLQDSLQKHLHLKGFIIQQKSS
ncbi:MAG TPA: SPOR domain-containing protein [Mariprofundaceae bacterium]|nr:SPOR domain-containing protein [Mariprofundaceae bacterium]